MTENSDEYLTKDQRQKYLSELTEKQRNALEEYKRYRFNSNIMTQINQDGVHWKLEYELINYNFDYTKPQKSYLKCACGRHVKYLYMCKGNNGEEKGFGINHLQQEAGIPLEVVKQISQLHHTIDRGTDTIISQYHKGMRFPLDEFETAEKYHLLPSLDPKQINMIRSFKKANLPLYPEDYKLIKDSVDTYKKQKQEKKHQKAQKKWKDEHWLQIREAEEKKEQRKIARQKQAEACKKWEEEERKAKEERKLRYQKQYKIMKDIDATWERVFWGCVYIIKDNFIDYYHFRIALYIMFNSGQAQIGDVLRTPQETRRVMTKFLQDNEFIHTHLMTKDPYLIEFLACLKDGKYLCKVLTKYGLIFINDNGQIIYRGLQDKTAPKGQTSLF